MAKDYKCCLCGRCHLKFRRKVNSKELKNFISKRTGKNVNKDDVICGKCRSMYQRTVKYAITLRKKSDCLDECLSDDSDSEFMLNIEKTVEQKILSPKQIQLNIPSTQTSHKYCIICKKQSDKRKRNSKMSKVPLAARTQAFIKNTIYIEENTRCCASHLENDIFTTEALAALTAK